jgi:hypothetical protein
MISLKQAKTYFLSNYKKQQTSSQEDAKINSDPAIQSNQLPKLHKQLQI